MCACMSPIVCRIFDSTIGSDEQLAKLYNYIRKFEIAHDAGTDRCSESNEYDTMRSLCNKGLYVVKFQSQ